MKKIVCLCLLLFFFYIPCSAFADSQTTVGGQRADGHIIQDEGTKLRQRPYLNFVGSGVTCVDSGGKTVCTMSGGGGAGAGATALDVKENDTSKCTGASCDSVDFQSGFDITESPTGEANISLDLSEVLTGAATTDTTNQSYVDLSSFNTRNQLRDGHLPVIQPNKGGMGFTGVTDDTTIVANGVLWQSKSLPDCTDSSGNHLNYTTATNAYSCGTSSSGVTSVTASDPVFSNGSITPNISLGIVPVSKGGVGFTGASDDTIAVGQGTIWQSVTLPNATTGLSYTQATNSFGTITPITSLGVKSPLNSTGGSTPVISIDTIQASTGGLGFTGTSDDTLIVGQGTRWQPKTLSDCDDTSGQHLNYDTATNTFSCGTTASGTPVTSVTASSPLLSSGGTTPNILLNDTVPVSKGGTGIGGATDDTILLGQGTIFQSVTVPNCADSGGNHLNYTPSTNTFSCGTSGGGSTTPSGFGGSIQLANAAGTALASDSHFYFDTTNDTLTSPIVSADSVRFSYNTSPTFPNRGQLGEDSDYYAVGRGALLFNDETASTAIVGILTSDLCNNGEVAKFNTGGTWTCESDNDSGAITGFGTQVLFFVNDNAPGGDNGLVYYATTDTLVAGIVSTAATQNPNIQFIPSFASDTNFSAGVIADADNVNDDYFSIRTGPANGAHYAISIDSLEQTRIPGLFYPYSVPITKGGTGVGTATDDTVLIGQGTIFNPTTVPNCIDSGGQHLNYTSSTNALSCGTTGDGNSGGSSTVPGLPSNSVQFEKNNTFAGDAGFTYNFTNDTLSVASISIDTTTLTVDNLGNRVGIGTLVPKADLEVAAGTNGTILVSTTSSSGFPSYQFGTNLDSQNAGFLGMDGSVNGGNINLYNTTGTGGILLGTNNLPRINITQDGESRFGPITLTNVIQATNGGTNIGGATEDTLLVGGGSLWLSKTLPNASNGLAYNNSTNSFSAITYPVVSFDTVFSPQQAKLPIVSTYAMQIDGGNNRWRGLFSDSIENYASWDTILAPYSGSSLKAHITYSMVSATSGTIGFGVKVFCPSPQEDIDVDTQYDTENQGTQTVPTVAGRENTLDITLTNRDGCGLGQHMVFALKRLIDTASDPATQVELRKFRISE